MNKLIDFLTAEERNYLQQKDPVVITSVYEKKIVDYGGAQLRELLSGKLRTDTEVWLSGRSIHRVYGSKTSILNRLIVSQLQALQMWKWLPGPVKLEQNKGKIVASESASGKSHEFDLVVSRHGPVSALECSFPHFSAKCDKLIEKWEQLSPQNDPTRVKRWGDFFYRATESVAVDVKMNLPEKKKQATPGEYRLIAFDVDGTLLQGDRFMWSWKSVWRYLQFGEEDHRNVMRKYIDGITKGGDDWQTFYDKWCEESSEKFRSKRLKRSDFYNIARDLRPVKGLRDTLSRLKEKNIKIIILSGGIDVFIKEKLEEYEEYFDDVFINRFVFIDGLFSRVDTTKYDFRGKVNGVLDYCKETGILPEQAAFVGDGFNDLSMIGNVGLTICFNSNSPELEIGADVCIPKSNDPDLREILKYIV